MDLHTTVKQMVVRHHKNGIKGEELHKIAAFQAMCFFCHAETKDPKRCSACRAVVYCSTECAKSAWKKPSSIPLPGSPGPAHKQLCPLFKRYMERVPEMKKIIQYFPWGHLAQDDTFPLLIFLAERNLLGSHGFGYWSSSPVLTQHDDDPGPVVLAGRPGRMEEMYQETTKKSGYFHGYMLLGTSHPSEKIAWHGLPDDQIPWYQFDDTGGRKPPARLQPGQILSSWKEWYEWRGLPMDSPVALAMHHVMSCYFMLTASLGHKPLAPDAPRKRLCVHFLGAEVELNCIPTFGELALLLPGYDFTFVFYGPSVYKLTSLAAQSHPGSLAAIKDGPIFTYTASPSLGGSRISVSLHSEYPLWSAEQVAAPKPWPDVILALNATISRYSAEWGHVIVACIPRGIPFVSTDYTENSLENYTAPKIEAVFAAMLQSFREDKGGLRSVAGEEFYGKMEAKRGRPWEVRMNPFMMPGQRQVSNSRFPYANNGFVFEVIVSLEKPKRAL